MAKPPSHKILLMLPFWEGDKAQATALARLMADMHQRHSEDFDILFVARSDCKHDEAAIAHVKKRFDVFKHTAKRGPTGWPLGCNYLFYAAIEWGYNMSAAGRCPNYSGFFNCGADTCPLSMAAFPYVQTQAHEMAVARTKIGGALIPENVSGREHINGDAMMIANDPEFLKWMTKALISSNLTGGWDWALNESFRKRGWRDFPKVRSLWNTPTMTPSAITAIKNSGVLWLHGIKDYSVQKYVRAHL
jgi:hypothetical protein